MSRLRLFIACSLDGFIAGPGGDLSWLPQPSGDDDPSEPDDFGYSEFMADIGCLLIGRATYDAVRSMTTEWPYERHVVVATHRPLRDVPVGVTAAQGDIAELAAVARRRAGDKDVYVDGGDVIRQCLDAGMLDEVNVTVCPVVLGAGHALFAGAKQRRELALIAQRELPGGLVQLSYRVKNAAL